MSKIIVQDQSIEFVIVTALAEERDAILAKLAGFHKLPPTEDDIRTYYIASLPVNFPDKTSGAYKVIVMCLLGMGRVHAVTATADAIRRWHPHYILLVGIAGGVASKKIRIGDVLVSDQIVDYELQKLIPNKEPQIRWEIQRADPRLLDACLNYRDESWERLIQVERPEPGKPSLKIGPIASGDKVIAFNRVLREYSKTWPKLIGIEMEASGVATAAFQSVEKPGFFMVRGVSDLADKNKNSPDVEKWRLYACDVAASFAISLLKSGPIPLSKIQSLQKINRVRIILDGEFKDFNQFRQHDVILVLAALFRVDSDDVKVLKVEKGSIVITIEIPESAANTFYELAVKQDPRVIQLGITSVSIEGREFVNISHKSPTSIGDPSGRTQGWLSMDYNLGIKKLMGLLEQKTSQEALVQLRTLEERLLRNQHDERLFGSSETIKNDRSQIIYSLNALAIGECDISFNELCEENYSKQRYIPSDQKTEKRLGRIESIYAGKKEEAFQHKNEKAMPAPPQVNLSKIRKIFLECDDFFTDARLRALFNDPRLSVFKSSLPEASSLAERVDLVCAYLTTKRFSNGEGLLSVFLKVLWEKTPAEDKLLAGIEEIMRDNGIQFDPKAGDSIPPVAGESITSEISARYKKIIQRYRQNLLTIEEQMASFVDPRMVLPDIKIAREEDIKKIHDLEDEIYSQVPLPESISREAITTQATNQEILDRLDRLDWALESRFEQLGKDIRRQFDDIKRGQAFIYQRLQPADIDLLNSIKEEVHQARLEQGEMNRTLDAVRRAIKYINESGVKINDPEVTKALADIYMSVNSRLSLEEQFELTLPIIPLLLNYKLNLGGSVDLKAVWEELVRRVRRA